ncbi:tRNA uridine-5-carboxymethylaminomethyl(34) synthesis enzyme MnmG [Chryseobacterium salipaludis]|uniref:tRNA uridine-5-carboxymethylaminomethyl(34) synthesis enzyme MnmG n=1 Tax=Chryseobacterium TaxID=59732 RepID=UPI001FF5AAF6|nr:MULTISPECIES: tRNA uridine-5-carboxymethylaminomethyl(34) synthesis enzyme MnmG [Chryseobacterium]MCJ8497403.1 tRNA uridine-5-carboxymethylaminomethyl(34) synthesis enzyme MnmG [Chryseobacterium salipaludis]MCX3295810.1 tRNA uridine-5-carboxymethylaminomethyl(34) synthesis enzyme MnmG [Planobacterium sp. JC490]
MINEIYDVIVVGGGHAGCEAAAATANLGSKTLLITMNMQTIGQMSCNPAMGGIAKGQIVREIDAMGGYSGIVADKSAIQFKMLNLSKGPAMWSPRTQNDRMLFAEEWRHMLEQTENLDFFQDMVKGLTVENNKVTGVLTSLGITIKGKSVILTNGTFLNGLIHVGDKQLGGGRMGEPKAYGITEQLTDLGFVAGRMKTGTPARVDGRTLDYSKMEEQKGDENPQKFSYTNTPKLTKQLSCHITYTNDTVHDILREGFDRSPMFNGTIQSTGPRYCPSIEDKINRFAERNRHQLFVEPEGWRTVEIYVNGFSSSLPEEIQLRAMREIPGFEKVKVFRPGYAIEYDYFPPTQLKHTLETKLIENLYFAGQINGTTGYEEAAGQGLLAGINAHLKNNEKEPFILSRDEAYIGVLIDDLITKGTDEPYRMFTSRAEYRLLLRQDNADIRLTEKSYQIGLASAERLARVEHKIKESRELEDILRSTSLKPGQVNPVLESIASAPVDQAYRAAQILTRPNMTLEKLEEIDAVKLQTAHFETEVREQAEINIKYKGYIEKEKENVAKVSRLETIRIPEQFDYQQLKSLSAEARQKLSDVRPVNIAQASRISGVSPADINILLVYLN